VATSLSSIQGWDPARRVLVAADTAYSVALENGVQEVSIHVAGDTDARYRVTDGAMSGSDDWMPLLAGAVSVIAISRVSHGASPTLYLATGGASVVVRILPSPVRGE